MSITINPPKAEENPQWQAALRGESFDDSFLAGRSLVTFSPNRGLYLSGEPIDRLSARFHGRLSNNAKHKPKAMGCALYAAAQAALGNNSERVCGFIFAMNNTATKEAKRYADGTVKRSTLRAEFALLEEYGFIEKNKGFKGRKFERGRSGDTLVPNSVARRLVRAARRGAED